MNPFPLFHYTISRKELCADMPSVPFLLSAASFVSQNSRGDRGLRPPRYLPDNPWRGADCGGFTATRRWKGQYHFTPAQYIQWLYSWRPRWAATMDLVCLSETGGDPGPECVRSRQDWTTEMAWRFWLHYRDVPWCWVPTISGYTTAQFEQHAHDLVGLIRQMRAYYSDPGWWEDEESEAQYGSAFRVGAGSLAGRADPTFIFEVITRIQTIIGRDVPLHLWGIKLKTLQSGIAFPGVISCDSGAWNGLFGREHKKRRESRMSVVAYSWQVQQPAYALKIARAQHQLPMVPLDFWMDDLPSSSFEDPRMLVEMLEWE
jgi:hypothetical protein